MKRAVVEGKIMRRAAVGVGLYGIMVGMFAGEGMAFYFHWLDAVALKIGGSVAVGLSLGAPLLAALLLLGDRLAKWLLDPLERHLIRMDGAKARIGYT
jgi:hypothetical protein